MNRTQLYWRLNRLFRFFFRCLVYIIIGILIFSIYIVLVVGLVLLIPDSWSKAISSLVYNGIAALFDPQPSPQRLQPNQCSARVTELQEVLFEPGIYYAQYNSTSLDLKAYLDDRGLCSSGFKGNSDAYGLGIRLGIYLQWTSSLLANHLSRNLATSLKKVYLVFSIAVVASVLRMSFDVENCNFSIEIVILYYIFYGGYFIVYQAPHPEHHQKSLSTIKLSWTSVLFSVTYVSMVGHGAWFWTYGYQHRFFQMPCGTIHFFFGELNHRYFPIMRRILSIMTWCGSIELLFIFLAMYTIFAKDIWKQVAKSDIVKLLGVKDPFAHAFSEPRWALLTRFVRRTEDCRNMIYSTLAPILSRFINAFYQVHVPMDRQSKILAFRLRCLFAVSRIACLIYCVCGIEYTLKYNKITEVNSIDTIGQYTALIMGTCSFCAFLYDLLKSCAHFGEYLQESVTDIELQRLVQTNQEGDEADIADSDLSMLTFQSTSTD